MKKLLVLITIVASVVMARADILYWMVDTNSAGAFDYDTVNLMYNGGSIDSVSYANLSDWDGTTLNARLAALQLAYPTDALNTTLPGSYDSGSFWVELSKGSDFVAVSAKRVLADLSGNIIKGGIDTPAAAAASFGSFAIPEPTSGLLFLMGGILLGLKRRRMA